MSPRPVPPRGMRDLLPSEVRQRRYLIDSLVSVYERYGFDQIEAPVLEDIERLTDSEAGENEKLIYKVLKRGLSFDPPPASEAEIVDLGLRYDLTVPLARLYATNSNDLPNPFRAIQVGSVWRAERPQKGRYRQFTQCDIDILGDSSITAEIELLCATADALRSTDVGEFTIRINDRRLLQSLVTTTGFDGSNAPAVLIALDKLDKIGLDGVGSELQTLGPDDSALAMRHILLALQEAKGFDEVAEALLGKFDQDALLSMRQIVEGVARALPWVSIEFDPTLVRGQGYYTGSIFEIEHKDSAGSIAGGGRYDRMIGKLSGVEVPAVGFSIGFERLFDILSSRPARATEVRRVVLLYRADNATEVTAVANELRAMGDQIRPELGVKNRSGQLNKLAAAGFTHWTELAGGKVSEVQPLSREGS